ncbi:MAG: metallophosphoesterase [Chloroflexota bacterium]
MSSISEGLSRALNGPFTLPLALDLNSNHKYILFSDQHKGAGDRADEFRKCKETYMAALKHYRDAGFTLILMGDVEELWEQRFKKVEEAYQDVLELEGSFPAGHYFRLWGNHDDDWMHPWAVDRHLAKYMPTSAVFEGIRFEVENDAEHLGTILLVHGHQGTLASDKFRLLSRFAVRIYRYIQRLTGIGTMTPAEDVCLRSKQDNEMYDWAHRQCELDLILIAGHTHRPVWSSRTHLQKLQLELEALQSGPDIPGKLELIEEIEAAIKRREAKYPPCDDEIKTSPVYFNTGCCRFDDGDITGIEIDNGTIRLIKWSRGSLTKTVFEQDTLTDIFERIKIHPKN